MKCENRKIIKMSVILLTTAQFSFKRISEKYTIFREADNNGFKRTSHPVQNIK